MAQGGNTGAGGKGGATAQQYGANPYQNASQSMTQSFNALSGLGRQVAQNTQAHTYNPALANAAQMAAQRTDGADYSAAMQQGPQAIANLMSRYQNPYEDQVVQSSADQVMRSLQQQQMRNGDNAIAAGAFGGGRHGVVEAISNSEAQRNIGDLTGQLRSQGFNTAAGLAGQDIANTMNVNAQNQAALNAQRQFGAGNQMQANLANQAAQNAAAQFNAGNRQDANFQNQAALNQARQFNAGQRTASQNAYVQNMQSIANNLANLGQVSFGMGNSLNQQQQQQGAMAQQLMQQILGGGQQNFQDLVSQPEKLLQLRLASLGMNPLNNATTTTATQQQNGGWGTALGNILGAAGNMFSFAPIALSSARFKHEVVPTGRKVKTSTGKAVDEVRFKYLPHLDPSQTCYTGVIAESLGDDPAVIMHEGKATAVDYSKLEVA